MIAFNFRPWGSGIVGSLVIVAAVALFARGESNEKPAANSRGRDKLPTTEEMIAARTDVWGDAAMRQPNGASYEFFKDLMPPVRWVNADFRHYPIVLSAPRAAQKSRLVSNGSAVNALANKPPMWHEQGVPVSFFVGDPAQRFGEDLPRLQTPAYRDGYLPIVTIGYESDGITYYEEAFAPVDATSAKHGTAMLRFSMKKGSKLGRIEARIDSKSRLRVEKSNVLDVKGSTLVAFGQG